MHAPGKPDTQSREKWTAWALEVRRWGARANPTRWKTWERCLGVRPCGEVIGHRARVTPSARSHITGRTGPSNPSRFRSPVNILAAETCQSQDSIFGPNTYSFLPRDTIVT